MAITLTSEQHMWLEAEVAAGRITSVEDALRLAVDHFRIAADVTDFSWMKSHLDRVRAQIARDEHVDYADVAERIQKHRIALEWARRSFQTYGEAYKALAQS